MVSPVHGAARAPRPEGPPVFVAALPLYHIYAFMVCLLLGLHLGGKLILIPNPRDVDAVVKALKPHKAVVFPGLSTLYNLLMGHEGFRQLDFSNLRISLAGGDGGAVGGGGALAGGDGLPGVRGLWDDGDVADGGVYADGYDAA